MENAQIAAIFDEIADLLELKGDNEFRIRSYRNAARTVRDLSQRVEDLVHQGEKLEDLPNIGKSTAGKICEILESGTCNRLEELQKKVPPGLTMLMRLPQFGPRKSMQVYKALKIQTLEELKKACEEHRLAIPFGSTSRKSLRHASNSRCVWKSMASLIAWTFQTHTANRPGTQA